MSLKKQKKLGLLIILALIVVLVIWLAVFIHHRLHYAVTNAVFVETDQLVHLSFSLVSGRLEEVRKDEGDPVQKGEVVALLDRSPYLKKVQRLEGQLLAAKKERQALAIAIERLREEVALSEAKAKHQIESVSAKRQALLKKIAALEAQIQQLERDHKRYRDLWAKKLIPKRKFEEVATRLAESTRQKEALQAEAQALLAAQRAARADLELAQAKEKRIVEEEQRLQALKGKVQALEAALAQAKLELSYCQLRSPLDGRVAKRFHARGDVVGPGEPILALVDPQSLYLLVLLEENKLHGVEIGSRAEIKIDAFPDEDFEGRVEQILPATAAKFALVPRDVSAGEFTKVAQRVPIKIRFTKGPVHLLKVGLGGEVAIERK